MILLTKKLSKQIFLLMLFGFLLKVAPAQVINIGGTGSSAPGASISPYSIQYTGRNRIQYIYRASDLTSAGATAGVIDTIAFYRPTTSLTATLSGFVSGSIRATNSSSFSTSFVSGFGSSASFYPPNTITGGWNKHALTQSFYWNGTDNLLFNICSSPPSTSPGSGTSVNFASTLSSLTATGNSPFVSCSNVTAQGTIRSRPVLQLYFGNFQSMSITTDVRPESCSGKNDGSAEVNVSNGLSPYTYSWSNSAVGSQITGLSSGTYTVTVTDATTSTVVQAVTVTTMPPLTASFSRTKNISCHGGNDGEIDVSVSNGVPPLTYNWSTFSNDTSLTNLSSGYYSLIITDSAGCRSNIPQVVLTEPSQLSVNLTAVSESCTGSMDGRITSSVSGGTAPYYFLWSNSSTDSIPGSLTAGKYLLTLTDQNGCSKVDSAILSNPGNISTAVATNNSTLYASQSNANYQWLDCSNSLSPILNETSRSFTATQNGSYAVEISRGTCIDTSNCVPIISVGLKEQSMDPFIMSFNQSTKVLTVSSNAEQSLKNSPLLIFNMNGQIVYENQLSGSSSRFNLEALSPGLHIVKIQEETKKIMVFK